MAQTLVIPNGYKPKLDLMYTVIAIKELKDHFENNLSQALNLIKISAPLLSKTGRGINDNLSGVEPMVSFDALDFNNTQIEIVQSLTKWKRIALAKYGFTLDEGFYTNMKAIRRDERLDNLHSLYVDQWDWEKVISEEQSNLETLKAEVQKVYRAIKKTESYLREFHPRLDPVLPEEVYFITTQELERLYPSLSVKEREDEITREYRAVFIMQKGDLLSSGKKHDSRSPDHDVWALNGDLIFWYPTLERSIEISSMGIRADKKALSKQLKLANDEARETLDYHQAVLNDRLPFTIGGGIGQSRLCMFLLKKAHIGEVQVSVWTDQIIKDCQEANIPLL